MPARRSATIPRRYKKISYNPLYRKRARRVGISKSLYGKSITPHIHRRYTSAATDASYALALPASGAGKQFASSQYSFNLSQLENYTELTAMYDQYDIEKVVVSFMWSPCSQVDATNPIGSATYPVTDSAAYAPILWYLKDYDDSSSPTLSDLKQTAKAKMVRMSVNKPIKVTLTPAVATEIYRSGVSTAYGLKWKQRLDMAIPDVPHYGLKYACEYEGSQVRGTVEVRACFYVKCFNTR